MAKTASLYIRIDPQVKADVEAIYAQFGMSVTDAINVFLYQSRNIGGLPFELKPAKEELFAMLREGREATKRGEKRPLGDVFNDIREDINNGEL
ncbi:MAG: type II toxin-antitoxin system RelB/DinJ family antitoxin [Oscillospiraceae bacterium]|nr:type II toxin-antitoxin system RelB/DinJ family antitoxin [Oscillospiraceae bacterium]